MQPEKSKPKVNWAYFLKRPKLPTPAQLAERKRILAERLAQPRDLKNGACGGDCRWCNEPEDDGE